MRNFIRNHKWRLLPFAAVLPIAVFLFFGNIQNNFDASAAVTIIDGDTIQNSNASGNEKFDVYIVKIVNNKKFKRLVLNPQVFESYGHLKWENIKKIDQATMDSFTTSDLVRPDGLTIVYKLIPDGDQGAKKAVNLNATDFSSAGYDWSQVYTINSVDTANYAPSTAVTESINDSSRRDRFLKLIPTNPAQVLSEAYPSEKTTIEGVLEKVHADNFGKKLSKNFYFLKYNEKKLPLYFAGSAPDLPTGSKIRLKEAVRFGDKIATHSAKSSNFQILSKAATSFTTGTKKIAVIQFNFTNDKSQLHTQDELREFVFGDDYSVNTYYKEISFGKLKMKGHNRSDGDIYGIYTISESNADNCDFSTWENEVLSLDELAKDGFIKNNYYSIVFVFPYNSSCAFAGAATVGNDDKGPFSAYINGKISHITDKNVHSGAIYVWGHELGHNFGVSHASAYDCKDRDGNDVSISDNCTDYEYGDTFDIMGSGNTNHMNVYHKEALNFLNSDNIKYISVDGTYAIAPISESSSMFQSLVIPRNVSVDDDDYLSHYYLEFRQQYGFDNFDTDEKSMTEGVSIRLAPLASVNKSGKSFLIDTTPSSESIYEDFDNAALAVGKEFYDDIAGIKIKTLSVSSEKATVSVKFVDSISNEQPSALAVPTNFSAAKGECNQIKLTWSDVSDEESYTILRKDVSSGEQSVIEKISKDTVSYTDSYKAFAENASKTFKYNIKACNGAGCSAYSSEASISVSYASSCSDSSSSVTVISPNGGESWYREKTYNIKFNYTNIPVSAYFEITLWNGTSLAQNITGGFLATSSLPSVYPDYPYYSWIIPTTISLGSNYKIKVSIYSEGSGQSALLASDQSNAPFSITKPSYTLTLYKYTSGDGYGTVNISSSDGTTDTAEIYYGDWTKRYAKDTVLTLKAVPSSNSKFEGWIYCDISDTVASDTDGDGIKETCKLTMPGSNRILTPKFTKAALVAGTTTLGVRNEVNGGTGSYTNSITINSGEPIGLQWTNNVDVSGSCGAKMNDGTEWATSYEIKHNTSKSISGSNLTNYTSENKIKTYTLACTDYRGTSNTALATVTINGSITAPQTTGPTTNISASWTTMSEGNTVDIYWYSPDAAYGCIPLGGGDDTIWKTKSISMYGSYTTTNLGKTSREYAVSCTGYGGSKTASVTVNVGDTYSAPLVNISAYPENVSSGSPSMIFWSGSNCLTNRVWIYSDKDSMNGYLTYYDSNTVTSLQNIFGSGYYNTNASLNSPSSGRATGAITSGTTYKIRCQGASDNTNYPIDTILVKLAQSAVIDDSENGGFLANMLNAIGRFFRKVF